MYIFFSGLLLYFILIYYHFWWLGGGGYGLGVLNWVVGVEALYIDNEKYPGNRNERRQHISCTLRLDFGFGIMCTPIGAHNSFIIRTTTGKSVLGQQSEFLEHILSF